MFIAYMIYFVSLRYVDFERKGDNPGRDCNKLLKMWYQGSGGKLGWRSR